jgi:MFS family permease
MFPRDFWLYLASRFASAAAMMLLRASVAWHVYDLSQSAFHLGLIGFVQFLPIPTLMLVGGAVADTYERRKVMMGAQAVAMLCATMLFVASWRGEAGLPVLYAAVALASVAWSFDGPARAALLPMLVSRRTFPRAVTIASTTQALAFATGPALGGLVIAEYGIAAAYAAMAALVAVAVVLLACLRLPARPSAAGVLSVRGILEGLRFVRGNQVVLGCMLLDMLAVIFGGAVALLPIYATDILNVGARGYGLLSASADVGALVTSLALVVLPPIRRAGRALIAAVTVYGMATIVFGLSRSFPLSVLAYVLVGMADQVSVVMRGTAIQLSTPDALRGRVSGVNMIFIGASNQLGAAESGFVAALTGSATFAVVSGGMASLAVLAAVALAMPRLRRYRTDERTAAAPSLVSTLEKEALP